MKKSTFILLLVAISTFFVMENANALPVMPVINEGVYLSVIDGNGGGVEIIGGLFDLTGLYTAGYYLNGGSWQAFHTTLPVPSEDIFADGDVLELVLKSADGEYGLSNIISMTFEKYAGYDYYKSVSVIWDVPTVFGLAPISATMSISNGTPPDGIAPNPEPSTLLLLSSGLMGFIVRKKRN